jgi:hypothetical protein
MTMPDEIPAPTLDEFIASYQGDHRFVLRFGRRQHVLERGFIKCYVRIGRRWFNKQWWDPTLDLADIEARRPGNGTFTRLVARLRKKYPDMTLYVECVSEPRFQNKLVRMGFSVAGDGYCFVLLPEKVKTGHQ